MLKIAVFQHVLELLILSIEEAQSDKKESDHKELYPHVSSVL
jgi:hypothetical protein